MAVGANAPVHWTPTGAVQPEQVPVKPDQRPPSDVHLVAVVTAFEPDKVYPVAHAVDAVVPNVHVPLSTYVAAVPALAAAQETPRGAKQPMQVLPVMPDHRPFCLVQTGVPEMVVAPDA